MSVEGRGWVTRVGIDLVNGQQEEPAGLGGSRQPLGGGTSRMSREAQVRICERLGVQLPGPTRPVLSSPSAKPWPKTEIGTCGMRILPSNEKTSGIGLPTCPTTSAEYPFLGKLSGIGHECLRHVCQLAWRAPHSLQSRPRAR